MQYIEASFALHDNNKKMIGEISETVRIKNHESNTANKFLKWHFTKFRWRKLQEQKRFMKNAKNISKNLMILWIIQRNKTICNLNVSH